MLMFPFSGGLNGDSFDPYDEDDSRGYCHYSKKPFKKNRWYYHKKVKVEIIKETEKAVLLKDEKGEYWIPKKLIHFGETTTRQWIKFKPKYLLD